MVNQKKKKDVLILISSWNGGVGKQEDVNNKIQPNFQKRGIKRHILRITLTQNAPNVKNKKEKVSHLKKKRSSHRNQKFGSILGKRSNASTNPEDKTDPRNTNQKNRIW